MNIGFFICAVLGIIFAIMTVIFSLFGEKAANLISGFNSLTKEQRETMIGKQ